MTDQARTYKPTEIVTTGRERSKLVSTTKTGVKVFRYDELNVGRFIKLTFGVNPTFGITSR